MKSLRPKTLSPSPNSPHLFLRISRFFASYSSNYDPHSHFAQNLPSRRDDDRSRSVRVSVWWDFENCNLPAGVNVFKVATLITAAVRASGIRGPIQITAFGDVLQLSRSRQEALSATGIDMTHVPHGGKNSADRSLLADLMYWVSQNPPPAHLFLISGDRDFASILHKLRMSNYNILLASPESAPPVLCSAASIMWHWNSLVKGENLTGKHFNQPPDGSYGSWYGHCKLPLEDPFPVTEQPRLGNENLARPVPQAIMRQIWRLVRSCPKGIPITELRAELGRSNLHIDKDLYGYKKFSQFLMSMPHIIKLHHQGDGQFLVQAVTKKPQSSLNSIVDPSTRSKIESGEEGCTSSDADDELMHTKRAAVEKLPPSELNMDLTSDKELHRTSPDAHVAVPPKKVDEQHIIDKKALEMLTGHAASSEVTNSDADENSMRAKRAAISKSPPPAPNTDVTSDEAQQWPSPDDSVTCASQSDATSVAGLFKRFWTRWFGVKDSSSNKNNVKMPDCIAPHQSKEMSNGAPEECSTPSDDSGKVKYEKKCPTQVAEPNCPPSPPSTSNRSAHRDEGALRIKNYADKGSRLLNDSGMLEEINNHSTKGNIDTLWSDAKSSRSSAEGSATVGKSRPRREMAQNLQKDRLPAANSLSESDLLHFLHLLKVGQNEDPSQKLLVKPAENCSHASSRLSSVFQGNPPLSTELPRPFEHNRETKIYNTDAGVSPHVLKKRPINQSRNETCGPSKTETAGPTVHQSDPHGLVGRLDIESCSSSKKDDLVDSPWEEVGTVADEASSRNDLRPGHFTKGDAADVGYNPDLSDSDFLELEDEVNASGEEAGRTEKEDMIHSSPFEEVINSYYTGKKSDSERDKSTSTDGMSDFSSDTAQASDSSGGKQGEASFQGNNGKRRLGKSYSFVADPDRKVEGRPFYGILDSLDKSIESRMRG